MPDISVAHYILSELLQETFVFFISDQLIDKARVSVASKVKSDLYILYASYTKVHTGLHPLR